MNYYAVCFSVSNGVLEVTPLEFQFESSAKLWCEDMNEFSPNSVCVPMYEWQLEKYVNPKIQ